LKKVKKVKPTGKSSGRKTFLKGKGKTVPDKGNTTTARGPVKTGSVRLEWPPRNRKLES